MASLPQTLDGPVPPPDRRGWTWTSWAVILLAVAAIIGTRLWSDPSEAKDGPASKRMIILELQSRYIVGLSQLLGPLAPNLRDEALKLNQGSIDQRLRVIALAGELAGPADALQLLAALDESSQKASMKLTESQQRVRAILGRLYRDHDAGQIPSGAVDDASRSFLVQELDWFGELALHPAPRLSSALVRSEPISGWVLAVAARSLPETAGRADALYPTKVTAITLLSATGLGLLVASLGFCGAVGFAVYALYGMVSWRITVGGTHGGVYAETFALWLILFFGLNLGGAMLPWQLPRMTVALIVMPTSLIVLGWPIARGISGRQVREDIGLTCARHPLIEIAAGVLCYVVNLPLVILGVLMTVGLMRLQSLWKSGAEGASIEDFSPDATPSHPVVHLLADGDWLTLAQIFVLASVMAPIVEEIMFRGVLHRHCRELTGRWWPALSALLSTTLVSFIFAAIHPQGLVTIPPLMFMAFGFSLAREWRGSLLPSMFAHGMSNAAVLTMVTIALSR